MRQYWKTLLTCALLLAAPAQIVAQEHREACKPDGNKTLLLVDRSTKFDAIDAKDFLEGMDEIYSQVRSGDRLIVHLLSIDALSTRPLLDVCRPKCGSDVWSYLECDRVKQDKADKKYQVEVVEKLKSMLGKQEETSRSMLLEGITQLTEEYKPIMFNKLFVYSDLLEYSENAEPRQILDPNAKNALLDGLKAKQLIPSLAGVDVLVFGVGRWHDGNRRGLRLVERRALGSFWEAWFRLGGAKSVVISERYLR